MKRIKEDQLKSVVQEFDASAGVLILFKNPTLNECEYSCAVFGITEENYEIPITLFEKTLSELKETWGTKPQTIN